MPFSACSCLCRAAPGVRGDAKQPNSWLMWHMGGFSCSAHGANAGLQLGVGFEGGPAGHRGAMGVLPRLLSF